MPHELKKYQPKQYVQIKHPEWSKNATIYEVNLRQYTTEGTFEAFATHLPRLRQMGVDILWLMPIHPIGVKNRKGTLGSFYSIRDFYDVNPEFGTLEDLKKLVKQVHALGMYIIIDWVANHSAWDNELVQIHPEWYTKTDEGNFRPTPWYDWDDIIEFDFSQPAFRQYMTEAMKYWVKETGIDGFRCDVAGFVPVDFWETARAELDRIKPVFMLAEWESRDLHQKAFDMTYAWSLWEKMVTVSKDPSKMHILTEYLAHDVNTFPAAAYRMNFTDNHDKNAWEGNPVKNFGEALPLFMVFAGLVNGMPLVYSGQEAGLGRSLKFFDKDPIIWKDHPNAKIYQTLFELKHRNQALWNGNNGGHMNQIINDHPQQVISFYREKNGQQVIGIFNFSNENQKTQFDFSKLKGNYKNVFEYNLVELLETGIFNLPPHGFIILERSS
ncbi:MAG TPA: alpha-amylase family glycosyl hydrolase [Bacteroidales bacterium]|nr:alpha-amylase family glycosyl hydrolase [Bacteroidales bacterium]